LEFFPENIGAVFLHHGESFHQDIFKMEKRGSGKWSPSILADCCWGLLRETPTGEYEAI